MKTSRADSPAPKAKAEPGAVGKGLSSASGDTLPFSFPSVGTQKDLAISAALVISAALLYGKGSAVIAGAKHCWKEEGAVVLCAKLVTFVAIFVGCFGAVVHLWLMTVRGIQAAIHYAWDSGRKEDIAKGLAAFLASVLLISFGYTSLYYSTTDTSLTAWNFILIWGRTTLKSISLLQLSAMSIPIGYAAYATYRKGFRITAAMFASLIVVGVSSAAFAWAQPGGFYFLFVKYFACGFMGVWTMSFLMMLAGIAAASWQKEFYIKIRVILVCIGLSAFVSGVAILFIRFTLQLSESHTQYLGILSGKGFFEKARLTFNWVVHLQLGEKSTG